MGRSIPAMRARSRRARLRGGRRHRFRCLRMFGLLVHGYPARWCYALGAIAAREFVHDINKRVEASVCVGPRFGELAEAAVGPFAELPQAQVGFPGVGG